ncbi:DUF4352 domain-containing protein [Blastococcus sp. CT_GayMR16]|uniref:DUF4352 domain-containing protein n=1 Tax=Blastococcus sp. CT_GayMR16 TaxID=2559607 RepID=UPI001072F028|nr:DUF4352 domain-containing protein [Blastococcus sp. CT_GayMR16]TFV90710.1 DUF4352 domain-containing protein [Blastococcus sp. CT_GayMR16]
MSAESGPGTGTSAPADGRRRWLLVALAAVVVAALVVVWLLVRSDDDPGSAVQSGTSSSATSSSTPSASATESASPPAPGPTDANEPPPALPPVALDARGEVGNGVVATLPSIDEIQSEAQGPGNIAGPAIRVTVRIENGTAEAVSLGGVAVNMYTGAELTPASPLEDPSRREFTGTLAPGQSAEGVYVFSVPSDARDSVTVEVGYIAGAPLLLFTGPVG